MTPEDKAIEAIARSEARKFYRCPEADRPAILQAARVGAWLASRKYDEAKAVVAEGLARYQARGAQFSARTELDRVRLSNNRLAEGDEDGEPVDVAQDGPDVDELAQDADEKRQLWAAIEQLEELTRWVLVEHLEGQTYREIGAAAGTSHEWARQRVLLAEAELQRRLKPGVH